MILDLDLTISVKTSPICLQIVLKTPDWKKRCCAGLVTSIVDGYDSDLVKRFGVFKVAACLLSFLATITDVSVERNF